MALQSNDFKALALIRLSISLYSLIIVQNLHISIFCCELNTVHMTDFICDEWHLLPCYEINTLKMLYRILDFTKSFD